MFCAVGSAAMTTTANNSCPRNPRAAPNDAAITGCPTSLRPDNVATRPRSFPGRCPNRSATPNAISMQGTARLPMSVIGSRSADGSWRPVTDRTRPISAPTVIGLRNSPATLDITPGLAKGNWESNTVMLTGVNTSSCRSRTGAAYVMSPRT